MNRFNFLSLFLLMACSLVSHAVCPTFVEQQADADKMLATLKLGKTASDSIRILYDAFDLAPTQTKPEVAWKLLDVARRSGDDEAFADMVRQLSVFQVRDRNVLDSLVSLTSEIKDESMRKGAGLFVYVQKALGEARYLEGDERMQVLMEYVKEELTPKNDIYQDILDLYRVVIFIRHSTKGNMYLEYLGRLEKLINECDEKIPFLKNLFYTTAATYYSSIDFQEKAVECDRKLLDIIKDLEDHYRNNGRRFRNYDRNYYICYRRMLSNYEVLDKDEIKELYSKCAILAEKDEEIRNSFDEDPRPTAYRLLVEKDYSGALPHLRKVVDNATDEGVRTRALLRLIEVADSAHDHAAKLEALEDYNNILFESRKQKSEEAVVELQMRYNVNQMRTAMANMDIEKKNLELATNQKIISITLIALFLLAIGLMYLYRSHFKLLNKTKGLEEEKRKLENTIEELLDDGSPRGSKDLRNYKKE